MSQILKIGHRQITKDNIFNLLKEYKLIPQLAREILIEDAIAKIECTPEETDLAKQQFCQTNQITSQEQLQAWQKQQNISNEQLEQLILKKLKIQKFKHTNFNNQLQSYFLKRKTMLDKIVYSLIRTSDSGIAQELYFRIQENENSFADLAREYSQGPEVQTGGLVGPVEMNTPHPKIAQMLSSCKPGELKPPARIGEWYVIIRLEKLIPVKLDEAMQHRLLDELFNIWLKEQIQKEVSFQEEPVETVETVEDDYWAKT